MMICNEVDDDDKDDDDPLTAADSWSDQGRESC
jgi:hypothetical protein